MQPIKELQELIDHRTGDLARGAWPQRTPGGERHLVDLGTAQQHLATAIQEAWVSGAAWQLARQTPTVMLVDDVNAYAALQQADIAAAAKGREEGQEH